MEIGLATLDVFAQKGFHASSINEIALAAGIGKGTIYEYFSSKDELIRFSMGLFVKNIEDPVSKVLTDIADPKERLKKFFHYVLETFKNDDRTTGLVLAILQMLIVNRAQTQKSNLLKEMYSSAIKNIIGIITDGVSKGIFRQEAANKAEIIAINSIAYLDGIWLHFMINHTEIDVPVQLNHYVECLLHSISSEK